MKTKIHNDKLRYNTPLALLMSMMQNGDRTYTITIIGETHILTLPMASEKWPETPPVVVRATYNDRTEVYTFDITGADMEAFHH